MLPNGVPGDMLQIVESMQEKFKDMWKRILGLETHTHTHTHTCTHARTHKHTSLININNIHSEAKTHVVTCKSTRQIER